MPDKWMIVNGVQVIRGWDRKIERAQSIPTYSTRDGPVARIPFGKEGRRWTCGMRACGDCAVAHGQLHVPGCDLERCPACGGQVLTCGCVDRRELWL